MTDSISESDLNTRLDLLETVVQRLDSTLIVRLEGLEQKLSDLSAKIENVEEQLTLVTDISRYEKLQKLLAAANFEAADWETINLIQAIAKKTDLESITPEDMKLFPCYELQVIDRLWVKYSQARFGFSIQLDIYRQLGGNLDTTILQDNNMIVKFGKEVGWRANDEWKKCEDLDYTIAAPVGCHPSRWWNSPFGSKMVHSFFNRLITCEL
ncbi:MAG: GUN4 domain-containing protein [Prochloraceae cyanobacterium]|nr:GUN4 domain-containing protein [Prochloraceae cyanobacterium]